MSHWTGTSTGGVSLDRDLCRESERRSGRLSFVALDRVWDGLRKPGHATESVVRSHVREDVLGSDGLVEPAVLDPVARMGADGLVAAPGAEAHRPRHRRR